MVVREIIIQYLEQNGYDGLCNPELECGCVISDLIPCSSICEDCEPGYIRKCKDCKHCDTEECQYGTCRPVDSYCVIKDKPVDMEDEE